MGMVAYRDVLSLPAVRRILLLSVLVRIPMWAGNVVLTLHVVTHLHRSYGAAGLLVGVATVALALSSPWRGRRLDQVGLRRAVTLSLVVLTLCWCIAPFVSYWPLLALAAVASLFEIPSFSIVRQSLIAAVPHERRTSMLAIDSVAVEISFMIGPVLGVLLATYVSTPWALFSCQLASVLGGVLIWLMNPALQHPEPEPEGHVTASGQSWLNRASLAVLLCCVAATIVLTGTDVGVVAALRHMGHQPWIGWQLALWGVGSAIGGLVYGALHRTIPVPVLLGLLAATTLPAALSPNPFVLAALLVVAGVCCAPTITATVDALTRVVPAARRGEALGWHGAALTAGSALGAPLAGVAVDRVGWTGAFVLPPVIGLVIAGYGLLAVRPGRAELTTRELEQVAVG